MLTHFLCPWFLRFLLRIVGSLLLSLFNFQGPFPCDSSRTWHGFARRIFRYDFAFILARPRLAANFSLRPTKNSSAETPWPTNWNFCNFRKLRNADIHAYFKFRSNVKFKNLFRRRDSFETCHTAPFLGRSIILPHLVPFVNTFFSFFCFFLKGFFKLLYIVFIDGYYPQLFL